MKSTMQPNLKIIFTTLPSRVHPKEQTAAAAAEIVKLALILLPLAFFAIFAS